jgi:hypothetical protein
MTDEPRKPKAVEDMLVGRLVAETAITEVQAREIVALLGTGSWTSLVREARVLNRKR